MSNLLLHPAAIVHFQLHYCLLIHSLTPNNKIVYEPDQLSEKTVHGSHVSFVNEGLVDLDLRLSGISNDHINVYQHKFQCITVCHAGAVFTLRTLHRQCPIHQIYCHMETSHMKSFARDKSVRRWCRLNNVPIKEFNQTGVTRCLSSRDDFSANFNKFLDQPMPEIPSLELLGEMRKRLIDVGTVGRVQLHGICISPLNPADMQEIPAEHRNDRSNRQHGGEGRALDWFQSFLSLRGAHYSSGISSPNTSWTSGSRLSPYFTWGQLSLRYVIINTKRKQEELRAVKKASSSPSPWLRSLASFQSRMHWRSHFMQKLESQPSIEEQDQCLAFSHLRRQPNDFNQEYYDAWCQGRTGFPFVDACMRCLVDCGWLNFRMRSMLVSFATYNLWLDWKRISHHLARVFLDYEPGIHYPQLQMQAGTTGINAMRVYNVTKQANDQDPNGVFIRRYVPELQNCPDDYIHEPYNMPASMQKKYKVIIGSGNGKGTTLGFEPLKQSTSNIPEHSKESISTYSYYPSPIVDEKVSAKQAKDKLSAVRKQESTKVEAEQVFLKHGSRKSRSEDRDGVKPRVFSSTVKRVKVDKGQTSLLSSWSKMPSSDEMQKDTLAARGTKDKTQKSDNILSRPSLAHFTPSQASASGEWSCTSCTYLNDKPLALACCICGSIRQ